MGGEGGVVGESPATGGSFRGIGPGGIAIKKKVMPKSNPKKLTEKKGWKKSFNIFKSAAGGKKI